MFRSCMVSYIRVCQESFGLAKHNSAHKFAHRLNQQMSIHMQVSPSSCLVDECPRICVTSAEPDSLYTIKGSVRHRDKTLVSYGHFKSSATGEIDLNRHSSLGGTYTGLDNAGLFWSLQCMKHVKATILTVRDVQKPLKMVFSVHQGALTKREIDKSDVMTSCQLERRFLSENVKKYDVSNGRLRGTVCIPTGKGPFPGIIDMYGVSGGLKPSRAALLSSYGFVTYALPYFAYGDLVKDVGDVDLRYFEEALTWFSSQEYVDSSRIALVGTSLGAMLSIVMATYWPGMIRAVVSYNAPHHRTMTPLTYHGRALPYINNNENPVVDKDGAINYLKSFGCKFFDKSELTAIQDDSVIYLVNILYYWTTGPLDLSNLFAITIEKAKADFLFIAGEDDQIIPSVYCASRLTERLNQHGHRNHRTLVYPGTGHLIDPGLLPVTNIMKNPFNGDYFTCLFLTTNIDETTTI
ncbi:acyl-coenzyme A amino acid N-acyltransferase 1-like [Antedon mediterranea]|uniref:acyl-coenzyme A amino acid N-acyltransferase 1-like n=1 Tax=Antedon mediterranea TaxID=105859 RepID=UPI003AF4CB70